MSTFTVNKNLQMPANGSFNNDWDVPVNADWEAIDNAFGGHTNINVTGVAAGTYALTLTQYQPPIIVFIGTLTANLVYVLPSGVGGLWTVGNFTTGSFNITFAVSGGSGPNVLQGFRTLIFSDGSGAALADDSAPAQAQANAEAFATAADAVVTTNANAFATTAANAAQAAAIATAANASNLSSGIVANGLLPNPGIGPGVTIAADPGTTPSGAPGAIFYYF
jgi:hypothetical protein